MGTPILIHALGVSGQLSPLSPQGLFPCIVQPLKVLLNLSPTTPHFSLFHLLLSLNSTTAPLRGCSSVVLRRSCGHFLLGFLDSTLASSYLLSHLWPPSLPSLPLSDLGTGDPKAKGFLFFLDHLVHCHSFQCVGDFWIITSRPERPLC